MTRGERRSGPVQFSAVRFRVLTGADLLYHITPRRCGALHCLGLPWPRRLPVESSPVGRRKIMTWYS